MITFDTALSSIPDGLRAPLMEEFESILNNFMEHRQAALEYFKKDAELENLRKSADLDSEIFSEDDDLKESTETAVTGWPE